MKREKTNKVRFSCIFSRKRTHETATISLEVFLVSSGSVLHLVVRLVLLSVQGLLQGGL